MTADFGLVREENGSLAPRLVELQAFPSIFGFQAVLFESYARTFNLPEISSASSAVMTMQVTGRSCVA